MDDLWQTEHLGASDHVVDAAVARVTVLGIFERVARVVHDVVVETLVGLERRFNE